MARQQRKGAGSRDQGQAESRRGRQAGKAPRLPRAPAGACAASARIVTPPQADGALLPRPTMDCSLAAHADWSVNPNKRWVTVAQRTTTGWIIGAPQPVGDVATFLSRLLAEAK